MPKYAQYQQDALEVIRARLDPAHPGFTGSGPLVDALREAGPYLSSWVLPLVDLLLEGQRTGDTALLEQLRRDAARVRSSTNEAS
jgi:hypothetical protein